MDKCCMSLPTIGYTEGWDKRRSTGKENEATAHLFWELVKKYWTLSKSQPATCKAKWKGKVPGATTDSQHSLAFENTVRTCSVLREPKNITYMKAPLCCHTGFTRRDAQCHCVPSFPAHQLFLYGQRAAKPAQQRCGAAPSAGAAARARAAREPGGISRTPAGSAGPGREVAMPSRAPAALPRARQHLLQGYSSLSAPDSSSVWGMMDCTQFGMRYAADGHFPPRSLHAQLTESTWLRNISLNAWGVCRTS